VSFCKLALPARQDAQENLSQDDAVNSTHVTIGAVWLLVSAWLSPAARQDSSAWPIVELRQHTLKPGQRDVLISLFEAEFIESQEAAGMRIVGTFRDVDRPDRFVWIRAFKDMPSRANALPELKTARIPVLSSYASEAAANNYPQLPIRNERG
jgi:hypothetical protein